MRITQCVLHGDGPVARVVDWMDNRRAGSAGSGVTDMSHAAVCRWSDSGVPDVRKIQSAERLL